ncbi:MAG: transcriptional regulator [Streptococcaceae bacterium]|jgi:Rgg/GadR/MutR family transcriptional activator|nr:transcriptional regulator [Streptococcaceae bacterium]
MVGKIGETYKMIRIAKSLTQKEVVGENFSTAQLSKFETGESSLTVEKFFVLLENSNIHLDEFQSIYNDYTLSESSIFRRELVTAYDSRNIQKLRGYFNFWKEKYELNPHQRYYKINQLVASSILSLALNSKVLRDDIVFLTDYLDSVTEWGRYELWVFGNCLNFFDSGTLEYYSQIILGNTGFYKNIHLNQQMVIRTFLNLIQVWLSRKNLIEAFKYIQNLKSNNLITLDFFYEKVMLKYHEGHYQYLQGHKQGKEIMINCAKSFEYFGEYDISRNLNNEIIKLH